MTTFTEDDINEIRKYGFSVEEAVEILKNMEE